MDSKLGRFLLRLVRTLEWGDTSKILTRLFWKGNCKKNQGLKGIKAGKVLKDQPRVRLVFLLGNKEH